MNTEDKLLNLGDDTKKLAAQTLNYIKQMSQSGAIKKGIATGRLQELDRMIKHLQTEKLNLEKSLISLNEKYGEFT